MRACLRVLAVAIWLPLTAGLAVAQDWAVNRYDDGSFFSGALSPVDGPGFTLVCGERSARGLSPAQTGNTEPDITARDAYRLYVDPADIGEAGQGATERRDVLVVIGTTGYRLPPLRFNELFYSWETDIPASDPVFAAIAGQARFELRAGDRAHGVSARGFGAGFDELTGYCRSMFAAVGLYWAGTAPAGPSMRQAAQGWIARGCGAGIAHQAAGAVMTGDIDGDGAEDAVIDWRAIRCAGTMPQPYCGASMCSADLFLSRLYPATGQPENLLALGVRLFALTNGNLGVGLGGSLGSCQRAFGTADCEFQFYWDGAGLVRLN